MKKKIYIGGIDIKVKIFASLHQQKQTTVIRHKNL